MFGSGLISSRTRLLNTEILWKDQRNLVSAVSTSGLDWGSVFELMLQIAMKNIEESVRVEAVAIMNMILMRSNAYLDREKFARLSAFESISHLLRKESGLSVQKQAVHLLYLLLNCPKVMVMFCTFCKEDSECSGAANIDAKNFSIIVEGLADCVACGGNGTQNLKTERKIGSGVERSGLYYLTNNPAQSVESSYQQHCRLGHPSLQSLKRLVPSFGSRKELSCEVCEFSKHHRELKLRRSAVTLLAFLASSGKSGFEILLGKRLPKRTTFLALILKMLVSEMDIEVVNSSEPPEIFRERTLLIREALILLNRLVSNPQYSAPVLRILTNSRDMACLTVDIANRLSCKDKWLWQHDSTTRQIRESEIVDLARVFRKRVFTFLGDTMT